MSEPHELEERATVLIAARQPECEFATKAQIAACDHDACQCRGSARAVLNLVRQEQEKAITPYMVAAWDEAPIFGDIVERAQADWSAMIRAWWLSHTAKETSNG